MTKTLLFAACSYFLAAPVLFAAPPNVTSTPSTAGNATAVLAQLSTAFSGGNIVHQVQLSGNATLQWSTGQLL